MQDTKKTAFWIQICFYNLFFFPFGSYLWNSHEEFWVQNTWGTTRCLYHVHRILSLFIDLNFERSPASTYVLRICLLPTQCTGANVVSLNYKSIYSRSNVLDFLKLNHDIPHFLSCSPFASPLISFSCYCCSIAISSVKDGFKHFQDYSLYHCADVDHKFFAS